MELLKQATVLGMILFAGCAFANPDSDDSSKPVVTDMELAISAVNEIQALNDGFLNATTGVFHPKVQLPETTLSDKGTLSTIVQ